MKMNKIIIDGKEIEFSLGINEEEIEKNEFLDEDTIDLTNVVKEVDSTNGTDRKN